MHRSGPNGCLGGFSAIFVSSDHLTFLKLRAAYCKSKKVENHALAVTLFTTYYNFVRIHKTLRVTPAMAAGVIDKLWDVSDIVKVLEEL